MKRLPFDDLEISLSGFLFVVCLLALVGLPLWYLLERWL